MDVGTHSVTSMVVEGYLPVEKAKIKPKNNIKAKQKSSRLNSTKKAKKSAKTPNQKFQSQERSKMPNLTYVALRNAKWQP